MKKLARLWKRPTFDGQKYTYYLVYYDADGRRKLAEEDPAYRWDG